MRWPLGIVGALAALTAIAVAAGYLVLRASLPMLDGRVEVAGVVSEVAIERDELGVATITASNRSDAAFATGFIHAQERFFQMDLQRRVAAGELAELLGERLLALDQRHRIHRFRTRAKAALATLPTETVALYSSYADGVNSGLGALAARPFEYFLLGLEPRAWAVEDALLTGYSMWFELNDENAQRESELGLLRDALPPAVYDWLIQSGTDWDAPLRGEPVAAVAMPTAQQYDLRRLPRAAHTSRVTAGAQSTQRNGSNNWAVAGALSATGDAIVAGDMHLGHAVPNLWFRARIVVPDDSLDVTGVMLSGTPWVIAGSNGHVAWAFTNSYGDWEDLVIVETDPGDENRYRTNDGWRRFDVIDEPIAVKNGPPVSHSVVETIWGPLLDRDHRDRPRALRWLAHESQANNAAIARFEALRSVDEAIKVANETGAPPQNVIFADRYGRIGWTLMGRIPRRAGVDARWPSSWADGRGWQGWIAPSDYPRIVDPPSGRLWTANARTVDGQWLSMLGQGNHPTGARAQQIRDALFGSGRWSVADMLDIQLDDRALFLSRWQRLLLTLLDDDAVAADPRRLAFRDAVRDWGARAAIDSAGYRFVRAFRNDAIDTVTAALLAPVRAQLGEFRLTRHGQLERPVWQAIVERPAHLLDPRFESWDALLMSLVDGLIQHYEQIGPLGARSWGELNTVRVAHPMSTGLPLLSRLLDMPAMALPGDTDMPRVQGVAFGASQRMAVSPGRESDGYFHMPGGQSGHPLSPFYGAGHPAWADGEPGAFLPGPSQHRLVLGPTR